MLNVASQLSSKLRIESADSHEVFYREMAAIELADGQRYTVDAARRNHCGNAASIRESGIQDRLGLGDVVSKRWRSRSVGISSSL